MNDSEYNQLLSHLEDDIGGIGPTRIQAIRDEFPDGDDFINACRDAYENRNFDSLTEIDGFGSGYAHGKLALPVAEYMGWSGGDAEPIVLSSRTGDDL